MFRQPASNRAAAATGRDLRSTSLALAYKLRSKMPEVLPGGERPIRFAALPRTMSWHVGILQCRDRRRGDQSIGWRVFKVIKKTFTGFVDDQCTTLSAALAYYTIFALPPVLYLLLTVLVFGFSLAYTDGEAETEARMLLEDQAAQLLGNEAATEQITSILQRESDAGGHWWKTLLSFAGILVGATGVVGAIQSSLNRVWSVRPDPARSSMKTVVVKRLLSLAMILGLGFLLLVSLVVSTILSAIGARLSSVFGMDEVFARGINDGVQFVVTFVIFAAVFKFMPDAKVLWRDVAVGAFITTLLFLAGRFGLQWYLSNSDPGAQLGSAAASLVVILVWVYYSSMIFLLGAEATQAFASVYGGGIQPDRHAVRVVESIQRTS
ncbi:hypothetical protein Mal33_31390 [Rosistilla oblonga]|uniref:Uncharacterized protein n=2 Tax=Rosistilla oblonga TaxID=2527990 RepID=A0A518IVM4_9BACT|nr:hypothetical protein Mal33_31390 [Rosistilla oblonga]